MKVYIDGNDLMEFFAEEEGEIVVFGDPDGSRENLARWLARYCEHADCDGVLVFDDIPPTHVLPRTQQYSRVTVVNLPYGAEAWKEIAGPANRDAVEDRTWVVTSDRRLTEAMQHGRARLADPEHFVARVRRSIRREGDVLGDEPDAKFSGLTDDEVGFWLQYFGEED